MSGISNGRGPNPARMPRATALKPTKLAQLIRQAASQKAMFSRMRPGAQAGPGAAGFDPGAQQSTVGPNGMPIEQQ